MTYDHDHDHDHHAPHDSPDAPRPISAEAALARISAANLNLFACWEMSDDDLLQHPTIGRRTLAYIRQTAAAQLDRVNHYTPTATDAPPIAPASPWPYIATRARFMADAVLLLRHDLNDAPDNTDAAALAAYECENDRHLATLTRLTAYICYNRHAVTLGTLAVSTIDGPHYLAITDHTPGWMLQDWLSPACLLTAYEAQELTLTLDKRNADRPLDEQYSPRGWTPYPLPVATAATAAPDTALAAIRRTIRHHAAHLSDVIRSDLSLLYASPLDKNAARRMQANASSLSALATELAHAISDETARLDRVNRYLSSSN